VRVGDHPLHAAQTAAGKLAQKRSCRRIRFRSGYPPAYQRLGGKADHLAQQIGVRVLLHERAQVHRLVGQRWFLGQVGGVAGRPTDKSPMITPANPTRSPKDHLITPQKGYHTVCTYNRGGVFAWIEKDKASVAKSTLTEGEAKAAMSELIKAMTASADMVAK
jgi:hypothetical protein